MLLFLWIIGGIVCFVAISTFSGAFLILIELITSLFAWPVFLGLLLRPQVTKILKEI